MSMGLCIIRMFAILIGWKEKHVHERPDFSIKNIVVLVKSSHYYSRACPAEAVSIAHKLYACLMPVVTDLTETDTQKLTEYHNPHCACTPRVKGIK